MPLASWIGPNAGRLGGADERAHQRRLFLDGLVGRGDRLRHVWEELVSRQDSHLHARGLHRRNPIGHARHGGGISRRERLPHADRTGSLDVDVVLRQPCAREQPEQRVVGRVLKGHDRDGLAFEIGRLGDAGIFARDELHEALAAEQRDDLDRHPVLPHHDRRIGDDAAERRVAGTDLLCHVDAAAADREADVETGGGEIALALGELDRPERRQAGRCGEQISDRLGRIGAGCAGDDEKR